MRGHPHIPPRAMVKLNGGRKHLIRNASVGECPLPWRMQNGFGVEAAHMVLGHSALATTQIYAEADQSVVAASWVKRDERELSKKAHSRYTSCAYRFPTHGNQVCIIDILHHRAYEGKSFNTYGVGRRYVGKRAIRVPKNFYSNTEKTIFTECHCLL